MSAFRSFNGLDSVICVPCVRLSSLSSKSNVSGACIYDWRSGLSSGRISLSSWIYTYFWSLADLSKRLKELPKLLWIAYSEQYLPSSLSTLPLLSLSVLKFSVKKSSLSLLDYFLLANFCLFLSVADDAGADVRIDLLFFGLFSFKKSSRFEYSWHIDNVSLTTRCAI